MRQDGHDALSGKKTAELKSESAARIIQLQAADVGGL